MSTLQVLSTITLNLLRPNGNVVVYAKQYDGMSRLINASLISGESVWDMPVGVTAMVRYAKPDGTVGFYDTLEDQTTPAVTKLSTGLIQIALAQQALTAAGNVLIDVNFFAQDESRLTTLSFVLNVEKGSPSDDAMMSSDYFNILDRKINAVIAATTHPPRIDPTTQNWLLWDENEGAYADSGYSSVGQQGPAGTITVASNVRYQEGSSPTTIPTGSWVANPPTVRQGYYLWQRQILTFGDGTTSTSYLVARQGMDGSGAVDSVNGQTGAVTLGASDVGALPDNTPIPTKTSDLINDSGYVKNVVALTNNTDLNDVINSGFYRLNLTHTNAPPDADYGQMIVSRGGDTITQIVFSYSTETMYVRTGNNIELSGQTETWRAWKTVLYNGDVTVPVQSVNGQIGAVSLTASDVGAATIKTGTTVPTTSDISPGEFYLKLES